MEFKFDLNKEIFDNNNNKNENDLSNSFINDIKNIKNESNFNFNKNTIYKNYNDTKNRYIKNEKIFQNSKLKNKIPKSYIKIKIPNNNYFKKNNFHSLTLNTTTTSSNNNNNNNNIKNNLNNTKNIFYELDLIKKKIDEKIYKKTGKIILDFNINNKFNNIKKYSRKSNSFSNYENNKTFNKSFIQPTVKINNEIFPKTKNKKIINFYNFLYNNNNNNNIF